MYRRKSITPGKVNSLFHVEAINSKFNRNTANEEENNIFLRKDIAVISPKGKSMNTIDRLMKQKDFIKECKSSLTEQMANDETGYCAAGLTKKIEEYEKQLDSLDEQIAKEMAKQAEDLGKEGSNSIYKKNQPMTNQESNNKRMADITKMSTELGKSEVINSAKDRLEGEKGVLEAELKIEDSEMKRQRIEEIITERQNYQKKLENPLQESMKYQKIQEKVRQRKYQLRKKTRSIARMIRLTLQRSQNIKGQN